MAGAVTFDDAAEGRATGMEHAEQGAPEGWIELAYGFVVAFAREHEHFHVDDFWDWAVPRGLPIPPNGRALGPVVNRAGRNGVLIKTDLVSPSIRSHLTGKPIWVSATYRGRRTGRYGTTEIPMPRDLKPEEPWLPTDDDVIDVEVEPPKTKTENHYVVVPAAGGKPQKYRRVTGVAKELDDQFGLRVWEVRQTACGLARRSDLCALIAGVDVHTVGIEKPDLVKRHKQIDEWCRQARAVIGADSKANLGTAFHAFVEARLKGEAAFVPADMAAGVDAVVACLERNELTPLGGCVEVRVVCEQLKLCGTVDLIAVDRDGQGVIVDLKTGAGAEKSGRLAIAIQLAIYAHAETIYDDATQTHSPMPSVRQDVAYILTTPPTDSTHCDLVEVDIEAGWRYALLCGPVHDARLHGQRKGARGLFKAVVMPPTEEIKADELLPVEQLRAWLVRRFAALKAPGFEEAAKAVAVRWPAGVPGLRSSHVHSEQELRLLSRLLDEAEREYEVPFGETPPDVKAAIEARTGTFMAKLSGTVPNQATFSTATTGATILRLDGSLGTEVVPSNVVPIRPSTEGAPVPAVPDEGGPAPADDVKGGLGLVQRLTNGQLAVIATWLVEAKAAGLDFSLKRAGTMRRLAIYRALVALAPLIDAELERVRATLALVDPRAADPATPLGLVIGGLDAAQAAELHDLARLVAHNDPALAFSPDGSVKWDDDTVLIERGELSTNQPTGE